MKIAYLFLILFATLLYTFTIRGNVGIPTPEQIDLELNNSGEPFETSQERSRYAVILSLFYDNTVVIDRFASMGTPDVGKINGHYYSFFPPATSIIALPLFILGMQLGATQLLTFLVSTIFALLTMLVMMRFAAKLNLHWSTALFAALTFGFATNAWGYSVTLYAHLISAFLILSGLYLATFNERYTAVKSALVWILYTLAVYVDFPNLFIFLPIAIFAMRPLMSVDAAAHGQKVKLRLLYAILPLIFVAGLVAYGYYNYIHFGSPTKLSNTLPRVQDLKDEKRANPEKGSDAAGALQTRNMIEGLHSFVISHDRGVLIYSPSILLFLFAVPYLRRKGKNPLVMLLAVPATCLTLYTMFADPYGGWAFGSRYLVAVLPQLVLLAAFGLERFGRHAWVKLIYILVCTYSIGVSLLAPLTTNVVPPFVEARTLGLDSWYIVNWRMLENNSLNSYFYNHVLLGNIEGNIYYAIILAAVAGVLAFLIMYPKPKHI